MGLDRRRFLRQTAGAATAAGTMAMARRSAHAAQPDHLPPKPAVDPIIDTHQHLWDLGKFRLPWLKDDQQLRRTFTPADYLEATRGLNVVKAVYMEVAVDPSQQLAEAEHVIELCRRQGSPTVAAVIGGRPAADDFRQYITRFKGSPYVKGVRQLIDDPGQFLDEKYVRGIRLLGELGMSFDLCLPPTRLRAAAKLVDRCPQTRFILDHCGNADPLAFRPTGKTPTDGAVQAFVSKERSPRQTPAKGTVPFSLTRKSGQSPTDGPARPPEHDVGQWQQDIARLAERKHVVCKISGIVARAAKGSWTAADLAPIINHCLGEFGPDRVVFGSDWPVCTRAASLRQWVEALKEVIQDRSETERRTLLHDNALRFYNLA